MTIKHRLFISNIMMIVLPIILTMAMGITAFLVFLNITNTSLTSLWQNRVSYVHEKDAGEFLQKYEDTQVLYEAVVYKSDSQGYLVVFPDNSNIPYSDNTNPNPLAKNNFIPLLFILVSVVIVYFTNRTLTRHIFRNIMTPINTLVNGVHEIRDGNLTYRIEYRKNDEFTAVCSDFNDMAVRLLEMVNQRQKDEQSQKELIAGVSHDLRTPLTSIKSYVKGLQDGVANNPQKGKEYLDVIYRKTCEMESLIDQLFLFTKLDTGNFPFHFNTVSIQGYLVTLLDSLEYDLHDKNASITFNSECKEQKILLDGEQMKRVIFNIIENSLKYNQDREIRIDIDLHQKGDNIIMRFQDNGQGVSEQQLPRLFEIFYRGDEARSNPASGSGLGLAIAKKIITGHGGNITAENSNGLAVIIELPIETGEKA